MHIVALMIAAVALMAASPPEDDIVKFNRALAEGRATDAIALADKALRERDLGNGQLHADPVVNAMIGRGTLAARGFANAAAYFDRAPLAQLPPALRAPTAFDHGRALELTGQRKRAIAAFAEAAAISQGAERRHALYGQARLTLIDDPAAAQALLALTADADPADRWEGEFLQAAASSLRGDRLAASRFAALSWQHAADAPRQALAPLHAAVLRGALAAAAGDVDTERAMLQAANGFVLRPSIGLTSQLPVCWEQGIQPDDYVTFAALSGPYVGWRLIPVAASRADAIQPFSDSVGRTSPIIASGRAPAGTTFTVRCRTAVSNAQSSPDPQDPLAAWMAEVGAYPASISKGGETSDINVVVERIDQISSRFGSKSPLLIGPRWQLMTMLLRSAAAGEPVQPGQVIDLAAAISEGMRAQGAPTWLSDIAANEVAMVRAKQAAGENVAAFDAYAQTQRKVLLELPFELSRYFVLSLQRSQSEMPEAMAQWIVELDKRAPANLAPRDRQAWLVAVSEAQRVLGQDSQARATVQRAGLAPDLCLAADFFPKLLEQQFSYTDYPDDFIAGEQEGSSTFDFNLTPGGKVSSERVILSFPANLFDAVSKRGMASIRYQEPKRNGRPATCRGVVQPIVWRLEDDQKIEDFPMFTKGLMTPTT